MPRPVWGEGDLYAPYWKGLLADRLLIQRNSQTGVYQWPAQIIAHDTLTFDLEWTEVPAQGSIYSWSRVWHPVHPALVGFGPYIIVVVELHIAPGLRMLGNLVGDPMQQVTPGQPVAGVFERHEAEAPYTLLQWRVLSEAGSDQRSA